MSAFKDRSGAQFGRLTVERLASRGTNGARWECRCDCGRLTVLSSGNLLATRSCGRCLAYAVEASPTDLAWAAGFFDGEGSICLMRRVLRGRVTDVFTLAIVVVNTCLSALARLKETFALGAIHSRKAHEGRQQVYEWHLSAQSAERLLLSIKPYVVVKRRQVDLALEYRALRREGPSLKMSAEAFARACQIAAEISQANGRNYRKDVTVGQ